MSSEASVLYTESEGVARIVLNRPTQANTFDLPTALLFAQLVERAAADSVNVVVVSGAGARFCAGGDLTSMVAGGVSSEKVSELAYAIDESFQRLAGLDKPVIAAVQGAVAGAGLGLLLSCDLTIAARSTKFVMAYDAVGLTPDCGVSYLLPRAIGQTRALQLGLTGRILTADEALQWGLITTTAEDGNQLSAATSLASTLAAKSTFALGQAKRLLRTSWTQTRQDISTDEARTIGAAINTAQAQTLIANFLNR